MLRVPLHGHGVALQSKVNAARERAAFFFYIFGFKITRSRSRNRVKRIIP